MKLIRDLATALNSVCVTAITLCLAVSAAAAAGSSAPAPPGKLVDLGGHKLHVNCTGKGSPTVVIENGLGDFSFDWTLVQNKVAAFTRVCSYDRAGYAWSEPGPKPRTFAQINMELRDALAKMHEPGPYVLVGHSYGGPVIRNFAAMYASDVAGMVQVDAAFEGMRVGIGGGKTMRLGADAKGRAIPPARETMKDSDRPAVHAAAESPAEQQLDAMYRVLPSEQQRWQLWAQALPAMEDAEGSQMEWSGEYFAKWLATPQDGSLGSLPLVVLTRAEGGYDNSQDVPGAQMEQERKEGQAKLAKLSSNSKQIVVHSGHNMDLEAPDDVAAAVRLVVEVVRKHDKL